VRLGCSVSTVNPYEPSDSPPTVLTLAEAMSILRSEPLSSTQIVVPSPLVARPFGAVNVAAAPTPSKTPDAPEPASVVTAFVLSVTARIRLLLESATYSLKPSRERPIPLGVSKRAALPVASAKPAVPPPAMTVAALELSEKVAIECELLA